MTPSSSRIPYGGRGQAGAPFALDPPGVAVLRIQ
ncbi:hypothetical protein M2161_006994 [Streptomyces sp. SAI-133]|nr:hypothetical protein [Streptomyces sp. SAI-133]